MTASQARQEGRSGTLPPVEGREHQEIRKGKSRINSSYLPNSPALHESGGTSSLND